MIKQIYKRQDLPLEDLQRIGLATEEGLLLDVDDVKALLAGRRTDMLRLENLAADGIHIPALDAKLSLKRSEDGQLELMVHPIYREPAAPSFLTDTQAEALEKGEVTNVQRKMFENGRPVEVLVEFDKDTNEFIIVNTELVEPPETINNQPLTAAQKEQYKKGKEVETEDGTTVQFSAIDKHGIRSNKIALLASVLIDGGVSYVLFKALNALFNKKQDKSTGRNFEQALEDMKDDKALSKGTILEPGEDFEEEVSNVVSR